eukprot:TRINITY_DN9260_c0_g1_i5.p4 TRINITY_DN9260_c0_g1~~TRINITY_DN9260_c0_g1_i5.p4  ORF type:complete len:106 (-),score=3.32 TRINITY_DN9260_c0_g1_i5:259-576(-)
MEHLPCRAWPNPVLVHPGAAAHVRERRLHGLLDIRIRAKKGPGGHEGEVLHPCDEVDSTLGKEVDEWFLPKLPCDAKLWRDEERATFRRCELCQWAPFLDGLGPA